jgi:hypothetical protein
MRLPMTSREVAFVVLLGSGLSTAAEVHADPIFYSRVFASAQAGNDGPNVDDSGNVSSDSVGPSGSSASNGFGATASAWAEVTDGTLHVYAEATGAGTGQESASTALAQFYDTLVPTSSTLAAGTAVSFLVNLDLGYSLFGTLCTNTGQVTANVSGAGVATGITDSTCDASDSQVLGGLVQGVIGAEFVLFAELFAITGAPSGFAFADASNSLGVTLTPQADFVFASASGNSYLSDDELTPVPEPATALYLLAGMVAMTARRLRGRRR